MSKPSWPIQIANAVSAGHKIYTTARDLRAMARSESKAPRWPSGTKNNKPRGDIKGESSAVSSSAGLYRFELFSSQPAHAAYRAYVSEFDRILRTTQFTGATTEPVRPVELRSYDFLHCTVDGDNRQGECNYAWIPTNTIQENDNCLLQFHNLAAGLNVDQGGITHYIDRHLIGKNMATTRCEVDCWTMWPKDDLPNSDVVGGYEENDFVIAQGYGAPKVLTDPYIDGQMTVAPTSLSGEAPYSTVQQRQWNEWAATPSENPLIRAFFEPKYEFGIILNPGDELEIKWGLPWPIVLEPVKDMPIDFGVSAEYKSVTPYRDFFVMRKRNGPFVCLRFRGRPGHDEEEDKKVVGTGNNFSTFNFEYALVTNRCWSPYHTGLSVQDRRTGVIPTAGASNDVNQSLAANFRVVAQSSLVEIAPET